jgi:hypothetical protein
MTPERDIDQINGQLPLNDQLGLEWIGDDGMRFLTVIDGTIHPTQRIVVARISTWVGTSALGAMHWYARIEPDAPKIIDANKPNGGTYGGYMGKNAPSLKRRSYEVERRLTKVERDMNRAIIGKKGDYTGRYNDPKTLFFDMIKALKEKFGAGWIVRLELENGGRAEFPVGEIDATQEFYERAKAKCEEVFS